MSFAIKKKNRGQYDPSRSLDLENIAALFTNGYTQAQNQTPGSQLASGISDYVSEHGLTTPLFPHMGPGNPISEEAGDNEVDNLFRKHDINYEYISEQAEHDNEYTHFNEADEELLKDLKEYEAQHELTWSEWAAIKTANGYFKTKKYISSEDKHHYDKMQTNYKNYGKNAKNEKNEIMKKQKVPYPTPISQPTVKKQKPKFTKDITNRKLNFDEDEAGPSTQEDMSGGEYVEGMMRGPREEHEVTVDTPMADGGASDIGSNDTSPMEGGGLSFDGSTTQFVQKGKKLYMKTSYTYKLYMDNNYDNGEQPFYATAFSNYKGGTGNALGVKLPWQSIPNDVVENYIKWGDMQGALNRNAKSYRIKKLNIDIKGIYQMLEYPLEHSPGASTIQNQPPTYIKVVECDMLDNRISGNGATPALKLNVGDCHSATKLGLKFNGKDATINDNHLFWHVQPVVVNTAVYDTPTTAKENLQSNPTIWYPDIDRKCHIKLIGQGDGYNWSWNNKTNGMIWLHDLPRLNGTTTTRNPNIYAAVQNTKRSQYNEFIIDPSARDFNNLIPDQKTFNGNPIKPLLVQVPDFPNAGATGTNGSVQHKAYMFATFSAIVEFDTNISDMSTLCDYVPTYTRDVIKSGVAGQKNDNPNVAAQLESDFNTTGNNVAKPIWSGYRGIQQYGNPQEARYNNADRGSTGSNFYNAANYRDWTKTSNVTRLNLSQEEEEEFVNKLKEQQKKKIKKSFNL